MTTIATPLLVLRGGVLADGRKADITIDRELGVIAEVSTGETPTSTSDSRHAEHESLDCSGSVILTTAIDPHSHLDKALSARGRAARPSSLVDAINTWQKAWTDMSPDDFTSRATAAIEAMVSRGTTGIRTHVDVGPGTGLHGLRALRATRQTIEQRGLAEIQIVALLAPPYSGSEGAPSRRALDEAIELGIDVVGGAPHLDNDPVASTRILVEAAARAGLAIDLHTDESVDPRMFSLPDFVRLVREFGVSRAVASHCASLASQPIDVQERVAVDLAEAGVAITAMAAASLLFFGWDTAVGPPRGLAPVRLLEKAGVVVAAGADNVQDYFVPLGRFDPFETAAVTAMTAHVSPAEAWEMCTTKGRAALALPPATIAVGEQADLVVIRGRNLNEAVALASEHRTVFRRGQIIARSSVDRELHA